MSSVSSLLPDFIVIGATRSGTTSLHRWLDEHPDVFTSVTKEPSFFAHRWDLGLEWYSSLFEAAPPHARKGESSTSYTQPQSSREAALRMRQTVPDVRLIYIVRHPIERLLSHYRHAFRRARLRTSLVEAVTDPRTRLLGTSLYFSRLEPYIEAFDREQIAVIRFEDLVAPDETAWLLILDHIGVCHIGRPEGVYNDTARQPQRSWRLQQLKRARDRLGLRTPAWVRPLTRHVARRSVHEFKDPIGDFPPKLPDTVVNAIWDDVQRLETWLGVAPMWER